MSEINNKEVNETKENETEETNDKETMVMEQFNKLSPETKSKIKDECKAYYKEHPNATDDEKLAFLDETMSKKNSEANDEDEYRVKEKDHKPDDEGR